MALITKIEEITPFVATGLGLPMEALAPAIDGVEQHEIIHVISQDQFDALQTAYNTGNGIITDPHLNSLLKYVQRALANLTIAESMDLLQVRLTADGLLRKEKETEKTAYHYQKIEAQDYLFKQGYNAVEGLIKFLETNKANYPLWQASPAYTLSQKYFITGADDFQNFYNINRSRRTYQALMYIIDRTERLIIEDTIGADFMAELKGKQQARNLSPDEVKLLNRYIKPAVGYLTMAAAAHELGLEFSQKGVQLSSRTAGQGNQEKKPATASTGGLSQIEIAASRAESNGQLFLQQTRDYLIDEASADKFRTFYESELYPKDQTPKPLDTSKPIYNGL